MGGQISLNRDSTWSSNLTGVFHSSLALGDINNDGYYDLISMGCTAGGVDTCTIADKIRVYINNGTTFNENLIWESNTTNLGYGSLALGDLDNDGDLDLVTLGDVGRGTGNVQIYLNNGTTLTESSQWEQNLSSIDAFAGSLAFGDVDNDGDLDLALVGAYPSSDNGIYINNGTSLTKSSIWLESLPYVGHGLGVGALTLGDINNDGKLDLVFAGSYSTNFYSGVYTNNGTSLIENSTWEGDFTATFGWPSLILGDYNNDGDLDLAAIGTRTGDHLKIYENNRTTFVTNETEDSVGACCLIGLFDGSIGFGDYDNDGDLDLAATGKESGRNRIYKNYHDNITQNQWNVTFNIDTPASVDIKTDNMQQGSLAFIDINNDNNIDLAINGKQGDTSTYLFKVYISNASLTRNNTKPNPPNSSFSSTYINNILTLSWGNGSDTETNTSGLYYNLMVGNSTQNNSIVSGVYGGNSNPTAGYFGNMMQRKSIALNVQLQANKTYYWYVQTIDTGLAKSNWSTFQNFTTSLDITKPNITINYPSPNASIHISNPFFIFNATVTDANLTNVTLNANWTGSWNINQSNSSGINTTYTFSVNLTNNNDGHYAWYIGANDSSNNSETSLIRDFYLDRAYPIVRLISPSNASTWTSSSTVTFTYNVTDVDIANCSLIINNTIDQTDNSIEEDTAQTFTKSLSNAAYTWKINCTDYVGYTNSSSTYSLTVSYTAPSGNDGSSGGGGGGGGTTTKPATQPMPEKFDIDFSTASSGTLEAKQGEIKTFTFNSQVTHKITVSEVIGNSAKIIIESEPLILILNVGETKQIDINKDNINDFEINLLSIIGGKAKFSLNKLEGAEIVAREEVAKKEALFDVKISIVNLFNIVKSGREVIAKIEVFNINNIGQVDVKVDYYLTSKGNNQTKLAEGSDTLAVEAVTSFVRSLIVPYDAKDGKYMFNINLKYKDSIMASSSVEFRVIRNYEVIIVISVIILIIFGFAFYLWKIKRKEEKLEKKEKRLEKEVKKLEKKDWKIWRKIKS